MKRVTLKDISKIANVSETTVSLVLNNKATRISKEKKDEIKKIAKDLNYRPNLLARSLSKNQTHTIGLIIPDIENPFFSTLAKIIQKKLMENDYLLFIANSDDLVSQDKIIASKFLDYQVDGLIYCPANDAYRLKFEEKKILLNLKLPLVIVDRTFDELELNQVSFDNEYGGYIATKNIIDKGYRKIACLTGDLTTVTGKNRYMGYLKALEEAGIEFDQNLVYEGDYKFATGKALAKDILKNDDIDSIFISNDMMAYGFLTGKKKLGYNDRFLYIIGYDNLELHTDFNKNFDSVSQDVNKMANEAVTNILRQISGDNKIRKKILKPKI